MSNRWLIFDFDGVIADSEVLANCVLAEIVTALGVATTLEDAYRLFMGKRFPDVIAAIQTAVGRNYRRPSRPTTSHERWLVSAKSCVRCKAHGPISMPLPIFSAASHPRRPLTA